MMTTDSNPPLFFDCHLCGDCCSSWQVPVDAEKTQVLLGKAWVQERLKETRRELASISADTYRLPLTDENVCVFLGDDRRCLIEVNEGLALKPDDCKKFPFAGVRLPDGSLKHDTSAACKHIAEKLLLAFQPILPRPEDSVKNYENEAEDFPAQVTLSGFRRTAWVDYEQHWAASIRPLFSGELTSEQALHQAAQLIWQWPNNPTQTGSGRLRFQHWITCLFLRKPYGTWSWACLLLKRHYDDPRIFGLTVDLKALQTVPWDHDYDRPVNAFLYSLLTRKRLLARGASLAALLAMASVACLLVRWYARVLASLRAADQPEIDDVTQAIRLVERYYTGHQPRFLHWFCNHPRGEALLRLMLIGN